MEDIWRELKKYLPSLLISLIGVLSALAATMIPPSFGTKENSLLWARLSLILFAILLFVLSYTILLYRKLNKQSNFSGYISDPKRGLIHKSNLNDRICPACRSEGQKTQMQILDNGYWVCPHSDHHNAYAN